jgi:diguanylate cyclase (GGDEF)-like protein
MRPIALLRRRPEASRHRGSLARRLLLVLTAMLVALIAVAGARVVTFRATANVLEKFRAETVGQTKRIDEVRRLLEKADDAGEAYVETHDPVSGFAFAEITLEIDHGFVDIQEVGSRPERLLASSARLRWQQARGSLEKALLLPEDEIGAALDPFHDGVDAAAALLADQFALNVHEVGDEISALRAHERAQLYASLVILLLGCVLGGMLSRRVYRSVTAPLKALEDATAHLGREDLSHRVEVHGNDELARVGSAFNAMADKLQLSRVELQHHALHDPLTGLPNRALFMEQLEHAIARARRKATPVSVLYLDLDGFKTVNDTLGHEAGDEVLVDVAERLRGALREADTVARLGGDEFGIVLEEELQAATLTAQRIVRQFERPWSLSSGDVSVGVSIGVAPRADDEGLDELLRQADTAMYAAKASGKGRWRVFSPDLGPGQLTTRSFRAELQQAVEAEEFVVHYQPVMDLATGFITGVEALVRWNHPERGLLAPGQFLKEAEVSGHVVQIDRWVLREACRQVRAWQRSVPGAKHLSVHVNLSARGLQNPDLADEIGEAVRVSGLAPSDLVLEITETTLVYDADAAAIELRKLKELDVELALDDFGTGFSSLTHLYEFPIDIIKIDRSFIASLGVDARRPELFKALVELGKTLGLLVVAEGVEQAVQLDYLRSIGCERAQGYYFAKPLPADQLEKFLPTALSRVVVDGEDLELAGSH